MRALVDTTDLFFPHPNFGDAINRNVVQSEIEGGVHLNDVPPETVLEVQTKNHVYTIVHKAWGQALISGHPEFCPSPVEVQIHGSTWGGSMIMTKYLGRGMYLEFDHPVHQVITTSRIVDIRGTRSRICSVSNDDAVNPAEVAPADQEQSPPSGSCRRLRLLLPRSRWPSSSFFPDSVSMARLILSRSAMTSAMIWSVGIKTILGFPALLSD